MSDIILDLEEPIYINLEVNPPNIVVGPKGEDGISSLSEAYKPSVEVNPNPLYTRRDGANVVVKDDVIHIFGGWNENGVLTDNHYSSNDGGLTWVQESNKPFGPRHTFGLEKLGGFYYVYGTDYQASVNTQNKGVWRSTDLYNWTEINANPPWGYIWLYGTCVHNGFLYLIGGHLAGGGSANPAKSNKVWRSADGITWVEYSSSLPEGGGMMTGQVISHLGALWLVCPSNYADDIEDRAISNKIYKSTDDGLTWVESGVHPFPTQFANMFKHNGKVYYRSGYSPQLNNTNKLFYTYDMVRWYEVPNTGLNTSHATCIGIYNNNIYEFAGNLYNDIRMIEIVDVGSIIFGLSSGGGIEGEGDNFNVAVWGEENLLTQADLYYRNNRLGIGVADPQRKLDINGGARVVDNIEINTTAVYKGIARNMPGLGHGVTNKLPSDTAFIISDYSGTAYPNTYIIAVGKTTIPIIFYDLVRIDTPLGDYISFDCGYKSGNSVTTAELSANLLVVKNNGQPVFRIKGNGNIQTNGIPIYDNTAAAAADGALLSGSMFRVTNGNGTSQIHIKD